jgi:hypothetical protein
MRSSLFSPGVRHQSPERGSRRVRLVRARKDLFGEARSFGVGQLSVRYEITGGRQDPRKTGNLFKRIAPYPFNGQKAVAETGPQSFCTVQYKDR